MATVTVPNLFVSGTLAKSSEVNANFALLQQFIQNEVIQKDASLAFTSTPSGPALNPVSDDQLVRKRYVDSGLQTWTPAWVGLTLGTTGLVNVGRYWTNGREVNFAIHLILGTGGAATTTISLSWSGILPAAHADFAANNLVVANGWCDVSTGRHDGSGIMADGINTRVGRFVSSATSVGWGVGVPGTWAAGSQLNITGKYLTV